MVDQDGPCPHCGEDLTEIIGGRRYPRVTGVEVRGEYDGVLFYRHIPGCGWAWHRWSEQDWARLHFKAVRYIEEINQQLLELELILRDDST